MFNLADLYREYIEDPGSLVGTPGISIDDLVERLAVDPEMIIDEELWQGALDLHGAGSSQDQDQLVDLVVSGLDASVRALREAMAAVDTERFISLREMVEKYAFLGHWLLCRAENEMSSNAGSADAAAVTDNISRRPKTAGVSGSRCCLLLAAFGRVVSLGLEALLPTRTERDTFATMYLRPALRIMEHEVICKDAELRRHVVKAVCVAVKRQAQLSLVETQVVQLLCYYEHVADVLVELIVVLKEQFDHSALADAVLRSLSGKQWSPQDTRGPKNVATFIAKLAATAPSIVISQLEAIIPLGDDPVPSLRSATLDVLGRAALFLLQQPDEVQEQPHEDSETGENVDRRTQIANLVDLVAQRVNDANHFVRARALQALTAIVTSKVRINSLRFQISECAVSKTKDRSQFVRRNGFRLMTALIETHPFRMGDGRLAADEWRANLAKLEAELESVLEETTEEIINTSLGSSAGDAMETEESAAEVQDSEAGGNPDTVENANSSDTLVNDLSRANEVASALQLQIRYHQDALRFIGQIESCVDIASALLGSQAKADLIDAMEFFFLCKMYGVDAADAGIRASVHLVWVKATNDEGEAVQEKVVQIYRELFLTPPAGAGARDAALFVSGNLIDLASEADTQGLASLEQLMTLAVDRGFISPQVVALLWQIYGSDQPSVTVSRRRGAAMVLGMLCKEDSNVAKTGVDLILRIGLGDLGRDDVQLARYSCVVLERVQPASEWTKSVPPARLPAEHEIFARIASLLLVPNSSAEWFALAQVAIRVVNNLCEEAPAVFSELLLSFARAGTEAAGDPDLEQQLFSQEVFIAGEIGLNLAIDLDRNELLFKRRFREAQTQANAEATQDGDDELKMVAGSTEDDFSEAVREIRERELLFSDRAMLAPYARITAALCASEVEEPHWGNLGVALSLTLSKFMLVSSVYAEQQLPLLMQLAERSPRPVIRANVVVALGDLAMCFNPLIDRHTEFLYARLTDPDEEVQRTAMVTLTNLILKGQIKVKGQIVEMAKALESSDQQISRLAHLFFSEYSTKDNAIYNSFLDILSGLSADLELEEARGHRILKYIAGFLEKERQIKQLEDRLLQRLSRCHTQRQWTFVQYVLESLKGERSETVKAKLAEGFTSVEKVQDVAPANDNEDNEEDSDESNDSTAGNDGDDGTDAETPGTPTQAKTRAEDADASASDLSDNELSEPETYDPGA